MPGFQTVAVAGVDRSWLGSTHGIDACATYGLTPAGFKTQVKNGVLPSGTPISVNEGKAVPFDASKGLAGFIFNDLRVVNENELAAVAVLQHGTVFLDRLPVSFDEPAVNKTSIVFAKKGGK